MKENLLFKLACLCIAATVLLVHFLQGKFTKAKR